MKRRPKYNPSWQVKFMLAGLTVLYMALAYVFLA